MRGGPPPRIRPWRRPATRSANDPAARDFAIVSQTRWQRSTAPPCLPGTARCCPSRASTQRPVPSWSMHSRTGCPPSTARNPAATPSPATSTRPRQGPPPCPPPTNPPPPAGMKQEDREKREEHVHGGDLPERARGHEQDPRPQPLAPQH